MVTEHPTLLRLAYFNSFHMQSKRMASLSTLANNSRESCTDFNALSQLKRNIAFGPNVPLTPVQLGTNGTVCPPLHARKEFVRASPGAAIRLNIPGPKDTPDSRMQPKHELAL